jgi:putative endonuclease
LAAFEDFLHDLGMPSRTFHVYIMASASRRLYVGVTGNLTRRIDQHRRLEIKGFTQKYRMIRLVYVEATSDVRSAIRREKQIKGWLRTKKISLIESLNPEWRDLAEDILEPRHSEKSEESLLQSRRDPSLRSG